MIAMGLKYQLENMEIFIFDTLIISHYYETSQESKNIL